MNQKVSALIDNSREEYIRILKEWVSIPSIRGERAEGAPFGKEVRRMLDQAMKTMRDMGFEPTDYDGYACDMTLGDAEETIAVLGHLDVVPVGDGWTRPPFGAQEEDGRIYGRGAGDDKGPTLAALFALRAIRDAGIPLKKSIRLIAGCDEEVKWEDIAYYASKRAIPEVGFSPDAAFPVINTEKGILMLSFHAKAEEDGLRVIRMKTGTRMNVIPGECTALLDGGEELKKRVEDYSLRTGLPYTARVTEEGLEVTAEGISGHSAHPAGRRNAIGMMVLLLRELGAKGAPEILAGAIGLESDGKGLGCAVRDDISGALTCNLGILRLEDDGWNGTLDCRCPVTADLNRLAESIRAHLPGFTVNVVESKEPHHVPAESELVRSLLAAYEEESGLEGRTIAIGGGTYAKVMKQGVAFGALFPDEEDLAHQANENISIDRMLLAAKIYANALIRLAGA